MNNKQPAQPMSGAPNRIQSGVQPSLTPQVGVGGGNPYAALGTVPIAQTPQAMPMSLPQGLTVQAQPPPPGMAVLPQGAPAWRSTAGPPPMMPMRGPPVRQSPPAMAQQLANGLMHGRR
jgi:hypothetical protein